MHFEPRLWVFTEGVRLRIAWAVGFCGVIGVRVWFGEMLACFS